MCTLAGVCRTILCMQTFLPFESFEESARCLDRQRLGKQRVEAWQIWCALGPDSRSGWRHHPAVLMWRGFEEALALYGVRVCDEWRRRGYRDTMLARFTDTIDMAGVTPETGIAMPPWLGDPVFHRSHQSNLVRKLPEHYGPLFPGVPADLPYVWPKPKEG